MKTLQENLKLFYLGLENSEPFLYKNKDLTTHALIIGMTGSGKTGLGITLLEEAAIHHHRSKGRSDKFSSYLSADEG